jgi:hypothetical protein
MIREICTMHERAAAASPSFQVQVRIPTDLLLAVESFRRTEPDIPTRPEAVRRLLQRALIAAPAGIPNKSAAA